MSLLAIPQPLRSTAFRHERACLPPFSRQRTRYVGWNHLSGPRRTRHANPFGPSVLRKVIGRTDSHGVHYSHFPAIHTSKIASNPAGRILHPQPVLLGAITPPTAQTRADHHVPSGQTVFVFRSAHSTRSRLLRQASVTGLAACILTRGHAEPTRSSTTSYQFSESLPRSCPPISPGLSV